MAKFRLPFLFVMAFAILVMVGCSSDVFGSNVSVRQADSPLRVSVADMCISIDEDTGEHVLLVRYAYRNDDSATSFSAAVDDEVTVDGKHVPEISFDDMPDDGNPDRVVDVGAQVMVTKSYGAVPERGALSIRCLKAGRDATVLFEESGRDLGDLVPRRCPW